MISARDIKERALLEGFNKVGIVGASTLADEGRRLNEWLARGPEAAAGQRVRIVGCDGATLLVEPVAELEAPRED